MPRILSAPGAFLSKQASAYLTTGFHPTWITDLRKVNVFIGENNCGKSRLIRELFADDGHFVFICPAKSDTNLVHILNKRNQIVERIMVISDNLTSAGGAKAERSAELTKHLGARYLELECQEIENLLAWQVIKGVLVAGGETIAQDHQNSDYADCYLGSFIDDVVLKGKGVKKWSSTTSANARPVRDKLGFCKQAVALMTTPTSLTTYGRSVGERIIQFVQTSNGRQPKR